MELSIIIPTKERGEILYRTLRTVIEATKHIHAEILVVNDSKKSSPQIPNEYDRVTLLQNPKSGVANARNFGASHARSEVLLFLDDDFQISKESIDATIQLFKRDQKQIHLFNWFYPPELYHQLNFTQFGRYLLKFRFDSLQGWLGNEWVNHQDVFELKHGASYYLPIAKRLFFEIGGYNEDFPHAGAEDFDFVQRAKKIGVKFFLNKNNVLYHDESDRIELKSWLARKKRNGETLKVAATIGYHELELNYSYAKKVMFQILSLSKPFIFHFIKMVPNNKKFDWLYFKMVNILLALYMYEGYSNMK